MSEDVPTIRQIESLCETVRRGTYSAAARSLETSTARVSENVTNLEQKLRLSPGSLLSVARGRVVLTPLGAALLPAADRVINAIKDLKRDADLVRAGALEHLAIGCYPAHLTFVAPAVARFQKEMPSSRVDLSHVSDVVRAGAGRMLIVDLIDGRLDIVIAPDTIEGPDFVETQPLYTWQLMAGSRKIATGPIPIASLREQILLLSPPGHSSYEMVQSACLAAGFTPTVGTELSSTEGLASLAMAGLGVVILPSDAIYLHSALTWQPIVDVEGRPLSGRYALFSRKTGTSGSNRLQQFIIESVAAYSDPIQDRSRR